jgi:cobalt-zinc-cadmium efflux system membrane fusion protein
MRHRLRFLIPILISCFLFLAGCGRESRVDAQAPNTPDSRIEEMRSQGMVTVANPEAFPLATVESRRVPTELNVSGVVSPDISRTVPVLSLAGGRVVEIRARLGDEVSKGQVLVVINSPDLAAAFSDYQKFQADEWLARRQLERSRSLYERGAIAQKDFETVEDAEQKAKVDLATSAERIRVLGGDTSHPTSFLEVRAPTSGTIVEQNVVAGTSVRSLDSSPSLFTIADFSHVWVLCDVYENNLAQVHLGDFAEVRLNAFPDRILHGRVSNISRVLDPATRTAKVRLELANPDKLMRAGMFATATFRSQNERLVSVIPSTAILRLHDKDWVFVPQEGKRYRRVEIQVGPLLSDGQQEVRSGLSPGDKIVVNALQFSNTVENQ